MSEEFKNQFQYQLQTSQSFPTPKNLNVSAQEFNPRKLNKQQSKFPDQNKENMLGNFTHSESDQLQYLGQNNNMNSATSNSNNNQGAVEKQSNNWVPQKKNEKKQQWKKKGEQFNQNTQNLDLPKHTHQPVTKSQSDTYEIKKEKKQKPNIQKMSSMHPDYEHMDELKSVQKQMSLQNQSANNLLGFTYQEDDYQGQGGGSGSYGYSYSNSYKGYKGARRRGGGGKYHNYRPAKEYSVQSAFKFIVKRGKDYMLNLYDPNENIEWRDVVTVIFNMTNADDVQCPICLESLNLMVAPKITKCGHIFCWPCVLQYLAFERENNWKRCPLCNESIYKHELKNVKIVQIASYKVGSTIKFNLMVRNKANIIVKDKEQTQVQSLKKYEHGMNQIFEESKEQEHENVSNNVQAQQQKVGTIDSQQSQIPVKLSNKRNRNKKKKLVVDQQNTSHTDDKIDLTTLTTQSSLSQSTSVSSQKSTHTNLISLSESQHPNRTKLPTNKFPAQNSSEYHTCRLLLSDKLQEKRDLEKDLDILVEDFKLMESCNELQKIPYINEAIEYCHKEISRLNDPEYQRQLELSYQDDQIQDFQERKRVHNKKQTLKGKQSQQDELEENANDFYYFYQSSTGENVYLHPLCFNILQQEYKSDYDSFPNQIEAQVLEINHGIADIDDPEFYKLEFLQHLPDGAAYGFVEVDMSNLVSDQTYSKFEKQIAYRERHRKRKLEREENYAGKVESIQNEKFEQIKRQAINSVNTESLFLVPGVVRNYRPRESSDAQEEEEKKQSELTEEELKEQQIKEQLVEAAMSNEQKLWRELGDLIVKDKYYAQSLRKDGFVSIVNNIARKNTLDSNTSGNSNQQKDEFECKEDGFVFASSQITVMEAKSKKKRRK